MVHCTTETVAALGTGKSLVKNLALNNDVVLAAFPNDILNLFEEDCALEMAYLWEHMGGKC